jgi:Protein of unknown function (DUF1488)
MPLTRLNDDAYSAELRGIAFGMVDAQKNTVRCLVTYEAITDRMGGVPMQGDQVRWFLGYRGEVEEVASNKFDDGNTDSGEFLIRVGSRDLNPHLFR